MRKRYVPWFESGLLLERPEIPAQPAHFYYAEDQDGGTPWVSFDGKTWVQFAPGVTAPPVAHAEQHAALASDTLMENYADLVQGKIVSETVPEELLNLSPILYGVCTDPGLTTSDLKWAALEEALQAEMPFIKDTPTERPGE